MTLRGEETRWSELGRWRSGGTGWVQVKRFESSMARGGAGQGRGGAAEGDERHLTMPRYRAGVRD